MPAAFVSDKAPRPGRSTGRRRADLSSERRSERRSERNGRRRRVVLYIVGGLLGSGWWVSATVYGGPMLSKIPTTVHIPQFAMVSCVITVACWGVLLILGEATLFALAVIKAGDREQYDLYRNLMILWGYVLTLGIPRLFRRLPAQFAGGSDDPVTRHPVKRPAEQPARHGTPHPAKTTTKHPAQHASQQAGGRAPGRSRPRGPRPPERTRPPDAGAGPPASEVELRTALELLLRYAIRYIDEDIEAADRSDRRSTELREPRT
jgi:hypothetical protein